MQAEAVEIRPLIAADAERVSALVRRVFDEYASSTFEPEGIAEFHAYAAPRPSSSGLKRFEPSLSRWKKTCKAN